MNRGVAANSGLGRRGRQAQIGTFMFCKWSFCIVTWYNDLMFLHRVNIIKFNIKQNICTGMEVISLIPL